jgi:hypothetical protein
VLSCITTIKLFLRRTLVRSGILFSIKDPFLKKESDIHFEEKWNADYYDDYDKRR